MISFCWLPPDRELVSWSMPSVLTSNCYMVSLATCLMRLMFRKPCFTYSGR